VFKRRPRAESSGTPRRQEVAFGRYAPELYRYVLRRLRRPADAADLTQEIFERFLRGEGSGKVHNPQAYLFGIAAHVVADRRLAESRDTVAYNSEVCDALAETESATTADLAEEVGLQQELKAALACLPDSHRAAFLLTKWQGLSNQEAAQRLGLTEGSVMVYVCEARAKLKTLLKHPQGQ
jgi:RNA polymerase sigma factor (sigma-70 family)